MFFRSIRCRPECCIDKNANSVVNRARRISTEREFELLALSFAQYADVGRPVPTFIQYAVYPALLHPERISLSRGGELRRAFVALLVDHVEELEQQIELRQLRCRPSPAKSLSSSGAIGLAAIVDRAFVSGRKCGTGFEGATMISWGAEIWGVWDERGAG